MFLKQHFKKGTKVTDLLTEEEMKKYVSLIVDGRIKDLGYVFDHDCDASLEFMDVKDSRGSRIYQTSLRYLVALAVKTMDPKLEVRFFYNISRSIFIRVTGKKGFKVTPQFVDSLRRRMDEIIKADITFERVKISKEKALEYYRKEGYTDKVKVLKYRKEDYVHLYHATFKDAEFYDYLYGILVPSSGFLSSYNLLPYTPGILMQYPRSDCNGEIPPFSDEMKFAVSLASTSSWAEKNHLDNVPDINQFLKSYGAMPLINISEARINHMLADLGNIITSRSEPVRCICIAGPSSSGKTSFANRLMYELMSRGLRPLRISCDDFYIPRDVMKEGTDIESVDALDIPYLTEVTNKLIEGEEVSLPIYDFKSGTRKKGKKIHLIENQPIILEGIHALNPVLTSGIPSVQKFRIYIAPQPQVNLDNHTPFSMTDMRLLRRIARDSRTRNSSAQDTIRMWPNVRGGEFKYIYPTQENADYIFDSFLPYELCALRNIVLPQLEKVPKDSDEYLTALRLRQMVRYFLPIPLTDIPCNSIMREFVGNSSFKDAR